MGYIPPIKGTSRVLDSPCAKRAFEPSNFALAAEVADGVTDALPLGYTVAMVRHVFQHSGLLELALVLNGPG